MLGELPLSPKSHENTTPRNIPETIKMTATTFTKWGDLNKEDVNEEDISKLLYQDEQHVLVLPMEDGNKGLQLMKGMGYNKNEKLGQNDNGLLEPILLEKQIKNLGLGCTTSKVTLIGKGIYAK